MRIAKRWCAVLVGGVLLAGCRDASNRTIVTGGGSPDPTTDGSPTPSPSPSPAPSPSPPPPPAAPPPPKPSPSPPPAPPSPSPLSFDLTPSSGPSSTRITASGAGCTGNNTGVGLAFYDPQGVAFSGDGAAAMPDGTWSIPISITGAPGRYKITAVCLISNGPLLFEYAPSYFTVTG